MEKDSTRFYQYSANQKGKVCREVFIPTRIEQSMLFGFLKAIVRQTFKVCSEVHTEGVLELDVRYDNDGKVYQERPLRNHRGGNRHS